MDDWMTKGCEVCRHGVLTATWPQPERVATSIDYHSDLHRCSNCQSWWIFNEREAHVISEDEAKSIFTDYFKDH